MDNTQILNWYYESNGKRLHRIVDKILSKFGGLSSMDYDDFYSLANEVFTDVLNQYDGVQKFEGLLYSCLSRKIKTEFTMRNRLKRCVQRKGEDGTTIYEKPTSLDAYIDEEEGSTMYDLISSDFRIEEELKDEFGVFTDDKIDKYFNSLSNVQKQIVLMKMDGYHSSQIIGKLGITEKQYHTSMNDMKSYEKKKYFYRGIASGAVTTLEDEKEMEMVTTTTEKTKNTSYAISAISKKLERHKLRDDHALQRSSGQWSNLYKSELISDILQGKSLTQIIISEEIKNGITMHWLIDGKQRCTNMDEFLRDGFAISKNVQKFNIQYQTDRLDENGNVEMNEDGFPIPENKSFDIRKKKFSQLPEELKDRFLEYQVPVMLNLNCTKKEIAYDIARFNRCRPMNIAQNGWTGLEEDFAEFVDNILKMPFFNESYAGSSYRESNNKSGMMRRMIVESIMVISFLNDFNKDFRKMCGYLSECANDSTFIDFYALIERLSVISNKDMANVFSIKDSFLWFGLFSKFTALGLPDDRFADFVMEFNKSLHCKIMDGKSFDDLNQKSTKDKTIVINKLNHLEKLMKEFLCNESDNKDDSNANVLQFIKDNVSEDLQDEDIALYKQMLNDLTLNVDNDSELLREENLLSLLAIVAFACMNDIDLDEWLVDYFNRKHAFIQNQKENYILMRDDLDKFIRLNRQMGISFGCC